MLLLSCSNLSRGFDAGPLFQNVGFELFAGERVGLVGPNGVGKTTLLKLLAGLDRPDVGDARLHAGFLALAVCAGACSSSANAPLADVTPVCSDVDASKAACSVDGGALSYAAVQPIFVKSCVPCHDDAMAAELIAQRGQEPLGEAAIGPSIHP